MKTKRKIQRLNKTTSHKHKQINQKTEETQIIEMKHFITLRQIVMKTTGSLANTYIF